jgi:hypothetical protein
MVKETSVEEYKTEIRTWIQRHYGFTAVYGGIWIVAENRNTA